MIFLGSWVVKEESVDSSQKESQTKTQLSKLEEELTKKLDELGIADPTIINLIKTHPWLFYLLFLKTEDLKIGETKKFTQGNITLTITRTKNEQFKLSLVTKEDDGKKSIKTVEIKKPIDKLGELRKFIEQRFSFELDGERVWIYQTEGATKGEKVWKLLYTGNDQKLKSIVEDLNRKKEFDALKFKEELDKARKSTVIDLAKYNQLKSIDDYYKSYLGKEIKLTPASRAKVLAYYLYSFGVKPKQITIEGTKITLTKDDHKAGQQIVLALKEDSKDTYFEKRLKKLMEEKRKTNLNYTVLDAISELKREADKKVNLLSDQAKDFIKRNKLFIFRDRSETEKPTFLTKIHPGISHTPSIVRLFHPKTDPKLPFWALQIRFLSRIFLNFRSPSLFRFLKSFPSLRPYAKAAPSCASLSLRRKGRPLKNFLTNASAP